MTIHFQIEYPVIIRWNFYISLMERTNSTTSQLRNKITEFQYDILTGTRLCSSWSIFWIANIIGGKQDYRIANIF